MTVNVYAAPFVSPATVSGLEAPVDVLPPGDAITWYELIAAPPLLAGAANATATFPSSGVAPTIDGCPGIVAGVTGSEGIDGGLSPATFVAVTVNV